MNVDRLLNQLNTGIPLWITQVRNQRNPILAAWLEERGGRGPSLLRCRGQLGPARGQAPSRGARWALVRAGPGDCRAGGGEERGPRPGRIGLPAALNILPLKLPPHCGPGDLAGPGQAPPQRLPGRGRRGSRSQGHAIAVPLTARCSRPQLNHLRPLPRGIIMPSSEW